MDSTVHAPSISMASGARYGARHELLDAFIGLVSLMVSADRAAKGISDAQLARTWQAKRA